MTQVLDTDAVPPDSAYQRERAESMRLVTALREGDEHAFGKLYDLWFDRVYDVAYRVLRDQHAAAEVAQDAFLSAWRNIGGLSDPAAFGGWILRISRNLAFNRRKKDLRSTPLDSEAMGIVEATQGPNHTGPAGFSVEARLSAADDPARAAEDADVCALLWDAAEALGERDAEVLDLHLRRDLSPAEIAEELGITRNNANQLVHRLKQRLGGAVRARVLWRSGAPACGILAAELGSAGAAEFGKEAVAVITRHVEECADCAERQATRISPAALFAATPLVLAPVVLKEQIASALESDGVHMDGSHFVDDGAHHGIWAADSHDHGMHPHDAAHPEPGDHAAASDHGHGHPGDHAGLAGMFDPGHQGADHDVHAADHGHGGIHVDALHDPFGLHHGDPLPHDDPFHHDDGHEHLVHDDPMHHDAHDPQADPHHDPHHGDPGHDLFHH